MVYTYKWVDYNNYMQETTEGDREKFVDIANQLLDFEATMKVFPHEKANVSPKRSYFEDLFFVPWEHNGVAAVLMYADGKPAGMYRVILDEPDRTVASILSVVLDKDYRGNGLGRLLMQETQGMLVDHGIFTTQLNYDANNKAAEKLYETLGYEVRYVYATKGPKGNV